MSNSSTLNRNEYTSSDLAVAMDNEALNALTGYPKIINVEFDAMESSYEYRTDFDLGDLCKDRNSGNGFVGSS